MAKTLDLSQLQNAHIVEMYQNGYSASAIARHLTISTTTVCRALQRIGVKWKSKYSQEQVAIGADLYRQGATLQDIAVLWGTSSSTVQSLFRRHGFSTRTPSQAKKGRKNPKRRKLSGDIEAQILEAYQQGDSLPEIAARFRVTTSLVHDIRKRSGLPCRPRSCRPSSGQRNLIYISGAGRRCSFRSMWEYVYAEYLDEQGIGWAYESHAFILSDGTAFIPDFWIPSRNEWVEIKGYLRDDAAQKIEMFRSEYPQFSLRILRRQELRELGIDINRRGVMVTKTRYH